MNIELRGGYLEENKCIFLCLRGFSRKITVEVNGKLMENQQKDMKKKQYFRLTEKVSIILTKYSTL